MPTRSRHRRAILRDLDVLHALAVGALALLASGGLLFLWYLRQVRRVAGAAVVLPPLDGAKAILVFGKHCRGGLPDAEFLARIERARSLAHVRRGVPLLLLGGGEAPTEADVAARVLRAGPLPEACELVLEHESRDTLQNLRHARALLRQRGADDVVLISSRHHLARCALFAQCLRIPHRLCAAEDALGRGPAAWGRLLREAGYLMWIDLGRRWAHLIGHRRMIEKLS
jgi:uncharacterized SAM-binding protein YcdF (DUF218 family)